MRRTKILATLGPSTFSRARVARLLSAGADGLRLNFSHGTDAQHREVLRRVRLVRERAGREIALVADLQGPKIRLGPLRGGRVRLRAGASFRLDTSGRPGDARRASVSMPALVGAASAGDAVLLADGSVALRVERTERSGIVTRVEHGGDVAERAGVYLPGARLRADVLGRKDLRDLDVALEGGADYIAVSFVRDARDLRSVRRQLARRPNGRGVGIIAKIERAEALRHLEGILEATDAIMVARGDLGIEVPLERIAVEQKRLLARAAAWGRPAIVATQMLESMVAQPRPTRAEATDVANAVLDGADALMLSEESAVGRFPFEAVEWLDRIARATEPSMSPRGAGSWAGVRPGATPERAVAESAVELAERIGAAAIVTPTQTGRTAELVGSARPRAPVWALSSVPTVRRRVALVWGVRAFACREHLSLVDLRAEAVRIATATAEAPVGASRIVLTAGYPVEGKPTNLVTVIEIPRPARRPGRASVGVPRASHARRGAARGSARRTRGAAAAPA